MAVSVLSVLAACTSAGPVSAAPVGSYCVRDYGAVGDGLAKDTAAVQQAMDAGAEAGGGTVFFPPGRYLCGSLHLRSAVTLWLDAGATILGSKDNDDYDPYEELAFENDADNETSYFHHALIWGEDVERIAIVGQGTIDSNRERRGGPKAIALKRCASVDIKGITIRNCPNYCISLLGTDNVNIDGVTMLNGYADGIDPDACHNVRIANCHIETADDTIVPKASFSLGERRSCENITITNCFLATACQNFKLGTESGGDFKRIALTNCVMTNLKGHRHARSGIALETVDGANLDGVVVSNVTMVNIRAPIFLRLGNRGRDMETPTPGTLKNIIISNVVATNASLTCSITGIPGHDVQGVTLSNIRITYAGGGVFRPSDKPVPEVVSAYPDARMFGPLPAYGLYCRHVDGLTLSNVQLLSEKGFWRFTTDDKRKINWYTDDGIPTPTEPGVVGHALVCDDVTHLDVEGLRAAASDDGLAVMRLEDVRDAIVRGCVAPEHCAVFVEMVGGKTGGIALLGNDFSRAREAVALGEGVKRRAVSMAGNIGR